MGVDDLEAEEIEVFRTFCKKRRGSGDKVLELKLG